MADDPVDTANALSTSVDDVSTRTRGLTSSSNAFARAITSAFAQGATGAKSFDSVLQSLALRLSNLSVSMALKPAVGALFGGSNLFARWSLQFFVRRFRRRWCGEHSAVREGWSHRGSEFLPAGRKPCRLGG